MFRYPLMLLSGMTYFLQAISSAKFSACINPAARYFSNEIRNRRIMLLI